MKVVLQRITLHVSKPDLTRCFHSERQGRTCYFSMDVLSLFLAPWLIVAHLSISRGAQSGLLWSLPGQGMMTNLKCSCNNCSALPLLSTVTDRQTCLKFDVIFHFPRFFWICIFSFSIMNFFHKKILCNKFGSYIITFTIYTDWNQLVLDRRKFRALRWIGNSNESEEANIQAYDHPFTGRYQEESLGTAP